MYVSPVATARGEEISIRLALTFTGLDMGLQIVDLILREILPCQKANRSS